MLIVCGNAAIAQNLSASREPMYFGSTRTPGSEVKFKSEAIKENQGIDFNYPACPLCHNTMKQIYSDTAMIDQSHKWIKIVQCEGGNKVLLTKSLPGFSGISSFMFTVQRLRK